MNPAIISNSNKPIKIDPIAIRMFFTAAKE